MLRMFVILSGLLAVANVTTSADSLSVILERANQSLLAQEYDAAVSDYLKVLHLDPNNLEANKKVASVYMEKGDLDKARGYCHKARTLDTLDAALAHSLGIIYARLGDRNRALIYFESAVQLDSADAGYLADLGSELVQIDRVGQALPILHRADSLKPADVNILEMLGSCYAILEDYERAETYFDLCYRFGGASAGFFHKLAAVKSRLGKTGSAERYYREAVALEPDHRDCLQSLSLLYMESGQYPDAIASFERVIAIDSAYAPAWIGLGATCALHGQSDRSDSILHRLFNSDSTLGFQMLNLYREHKLKHKENSGR